MENKHQLKIRILKNLEEKCVKSLIIRQGYKKVSLIILNILGFYLSYVLAQKATVDNKLSNDPYLFPSISRSAFQSL